MHIHFHIQTLIHHFGYGGVFLILCLEMIGIPFPAESTLTISGIEWTQGAFSLLPLLLAAAAGNILGSSVAYCIGKYLGRPFLLRYGRFIGITQERLDRASQTFVKYQSTIVLFGKFIAGIRILVPYLAGMNGMSFLWFSLYNTISAVVWAAAFILVGKYIGIEWDKHQHFIHHHLGLIIAVVVLGIAAYIGVHRLIKRKHLKKTATSAAATHQE